MTWARDGNGWGSTYWTPNRLSNTHPTSSTAAIQPRSSLGGFEHATPHQKRVAIMVKNMLRLCLLTADQSWPPIKTWWCDWSRGPSTSDTACHVGCSPFHHFHQLSWKTMMFETFGSIAASLRDPVTDLWGPIVWPEPCWACAWCEIGAFLMLREVIDEWCKLPA